MTAHRTLPLLLALALLLGQQAGISHALSHVDGSQSKEGLAHTSLCAKCSTFGQLSSAVSPSPPNDIVRRVSVVADTELYRGIARRTIAAFRSRAPPHLS
jgi:hypothetical protein